MYTALDLARYIVTKCMIDGIPVSNLQLQKILYYVQKRFLKEREDIAFVDDIEAWQFGPVVPNVYFHFSGFGAMPITMNYQGAAVASEDKGLIDSVVEEKRVLNPWDLVEETHKTGGAWYRVFADGSGNRNVISIELINKFG